MIFRVDHFLADELVRRVVALRFLNRVFEPTWNAAHIDHVDISWLESLTLKDMVQNHLMEAMALVLTGQPARLDADSFRGTRVEALRAVATPQAETMRKQTIRARYTAGTIGNRQVPSYVDEPGVDPSHNTETYASLTVEANSPRWAGVPFTLRSGKALAADSAEIAIHHLMLDMLNSDPMLFIRGDEAEEAWRIVDPVMNAWTAGHVPLQEYPAGQAPPS